VVEPTVRAARRLRVLHVMASGAHGGGEEALVGLLPELKRRGLECVAAVGDDGPAGPRLQSLGLDVRKLDLMGSRFDPLAAKRLHRLVREVAPGLVHNHGTRAAFFSALAGMAPGFPVSIYTVHGLSYRKQVAALARPALFAAERIACRGATGVVSVSATDLDDLVARNYVARGNALHVQNAVNTERFSPGDRSLARRRLGLSDEAFVVGSVSRLVRQKSLADLVDAVASLPDAVLVVAGDGPERRALEERARKLAGRAVFLGERNDVPDLLPAFDLFALTSRWEGEPIALLEAMAAGIPSVATATTGSREVLEASGAGVLVPIGSVAEIAEAISRLRGNPEERRAMSLAGREAVRSRSYAAVAERLIPFYERFTESPVTRA